MALSMQEVCVPAFVRGLSVVSSLIDKAEAHASEKGSDPKSIIEARLAPDMLTFAGQIQRASDTAKATVARLTAVESPSFPDTESSFAELKARAAKTIEFLHSVKSDRFAGSHERLVNINLRLFKGDVRGDAYLLRFGLPNFYFHVTTAYDILRHLGVNVGKADYLGPLG
ncbi:MAG: DUF1993 domain-containing protein [Burkholderiaceae bacterium]|jgi:hypothetical protein